MRSSKFSLMFVLITFIITALATTAFAAETEIDWEKGVIRATGLAAGKSGEKRAGLAKAQAHRAARMDAERNLAEQVHGVYVTGDSSMRDLELEYDLVRTQTAALIKNMREIGEPKYDKDGTCELVMEIPLWGSQSSLAGAAFIPFKDKPKAAFPEPTSTTANVGDKEYTGLVVDCSGLGLKPVMSPVIKNENGTPIYGYENLDYDKVVQYGMASYARNIADQTRAGSNPLVVKATKLDNFNSNPIIKVSDSDLVLLANKAAKFLMKCAVVFLM